MKYWESQEMPLMPIPVLAICKTLACVLVPANVFAFLCFGRIVALGRRFVAVRALRLVFGLAQLPTFGLASCRQAGVYNNLIFALQVAAAAKLYVFLVGGARCLGGARRGGRRANFGVEVL